MESKSFTCWGDTYTGTVVCLSEEHSLFSVYAHMIEVIRLHFQRKKIKMLLLSIFKIFVQYIKNNMSVCLKYIR